MGPYDIKSYVLKSKGTRTVNTANAIIVQQPSTTNLPETLIIDFCSGS